MTSGLPDKPLSFIGLVPHQKLTTYAASAHCFCAVPRLACRRSGMASTSRLRTRAGNTAFAAPVTAPPGGDPHSQFSTPSSAGINNRGMAAGVADTPVPDPNCFLDCFVDHAFATTDGITNDLGTLPGGASSFAYAVNNHGLIVGQSQNGTIDPLTGLPEVRGVLWREGQAIDLGTLGGNASNAFAINDGGQVVGLLGLAGAFQRGTKSAGSCGLEERPTRARRSLNGSLRRLPLSPDLLRQSRELSSVSFKRDGFHQLPAFLRGAHRSGPLSRPVIILVW